MHSMCGGVETHVCTFCTLHANAGGGLAKKSAISALLRIGANNRGDEKMYISMCRYLRRTVALF